MFRLHSASLPTCGLDKDIFDKRHCTPGLQPTNIYNMCFDDRDTYKIRTYVRNGARFEEEYTRPRHGMSWRRKYGFGGSYYPSRYYSRRPTGHFITNVLVPPYGHPGYRSYPPRIMGGGHAGYSSGYGRYFADNRVAMPRHAAVVSALLLIISCAFVLPRSFLPHTACLSTIAPHDTLEL